MTEDQKYELAVAAEDYAGKRAIFDCMQMMNNPTDPVKRAEASVRYHIAEAECMEAYARLERLKRAIVSAA